jgi:hypothetical protein
VKRPSGKLRIADGVGLQLASLAFHEYHGIISRVVACRIMTDSVSDLSIEHVIEQIPDGGNGSDGPACLRL